MSSTMHKNYNILCKYNKSSSSGAYLSECPSLFFEGHLAHGGTVDRSNNAGHSVYIINGIGYNIGIRQCIIEYRHSAVAR